MRTGPKAIDIPRLRIIVECGLTFLCLRDNIEEKASTAKTAKKLQNMEKKWAFCNLLKEPEDARKLRGN